MRLDLPRRTKCLLELWAYPDRVLIFSLNTLSRGMPCAVSASSWESSSWLRCEQRA
ncbi:hypothetical protein [Streptomyces himalayensis]|uniref:Uncharacterized protein n=1 Tax=Streptomyces himalayensis subsp. himalayensis TaxID=2756131 RepID=A0A7W0IE97_9ACTN|nr:hypothetical protein [Streptomyces himalayensis]MBA2951891.1 hypothetical protein [Streptomyces himalayensis subsp. himalayensis]